MNTKSENNPKNHIVSLCLVLLLFFSCIQIARAETTPAKPSAIHVGADRLVSDRLARVAEFSGNVIATQDDSKLTCNHLIIYYGEKNKEQDGKEDQAGSVEKVMATGKVVLVFQDKIAVAEKAVYTAADDSIVMMGGSPKVTSGSSYVTGEKITINRISGKVVVDSGSKNRVKVEFHPDDEESIKNDTKKE